MSETKRKKKHFLVIGFRNGRTVELPMSSRVSANDYMDDLVQQAVDTPNVIHYELIDRCNCRTWVDVCQIEFTSYRSEEE